MLRVLFVGAAACLSRLVVAAVFVDGLFMTEALWDDDGEAAEVCPPHAWDDGRDGGGDGGGSDEDTNETQKINRLPCHFIPVL